MQQGFKRRGHNQNEKNKNKNKSIIFNLKFLLHDITFNNKIIVYFTSN